MHRPTRRTVLRASLAGASLAALSPQQLLAQVLGQMCRILVGFPPGAGADIVARQLAMRLSGKLAPNVIVENRDGAGGNIAVKAALVQPSDGSSLLYTPSGVVTIYPHTYTNLGFSMLEDFTPVSLICRYPLAVAAGPAVPDSVTDLTQFIAWARAQKNPVAYGSPGLGSGLHFAAHTFSEKAGLNMLHVPYRGAAPLMADLFAREIAMGVGSLGALAAQASSGRLRLLAITGAERSPLFPNIPTFEEQGVQGLQMREWHGLYIPGKAPPGLVERILPIVHQVIAEPDFVAALAAQGFEATSSTPAELDAQARADIAMWGEIVKASGFKPT